MSEVYVTQSGITTTAKEIFVKNAGVWTPLKELFVNNSGVWTKVFPSTGSIYFPTGVGPTIFTVPNGIYSLTIDAKGPGGGGGGADGGASGGYPSGGYPGARIVTTLTVTPGQQYTIIPGTGGGGGQVKRMYEFF